MKGVNLIPAARREARLKAGRARAWMCVAPLCAALLAGAYIFLRITWVTSTSDLETEAAAADQQIQALDKAVADAKATASALQPALAAAKAVGEQPDWGQLLALVSASLSDNAVLNSCVLEAAVEPPVAAPAAKPGAKNEPAKKKEAGRPERFTLALSGLAKSQDAVAQVAGALEAKRTVFDRVIIMESRRSSLAGRDAVSFRIECLLTDAGEGGAGR